MEFTIVEMKDLPNGDAEFVIQMDDETKKYLINYAILDILEKSLEREKKLWENT